MWRAAWHQGTAYGIGYSCQERVADIRLYQSRDGRNWSTLVKSLYDQEAPTESALVFRRDETCACLLRRDNGPKFAMLGVSKPPYTDWVWSDLKKQIACPQMIELPDRRFIAAVRLSDPPVRTALCWIDPLSESITEILALPSGGDTGYPGIVYHDDLLWISYHSSHEGKASVYLAKVRLK